MPLPTWLKGRHLTAVTFTPQTVAADGTLTPGSAQTLTALVTNIMLESDPEKEEINPVNATRANNEITLENSRLECDVLLKSNGTNSLALLATTADIIVAVFTRGGQTWTFTGSRGRFSDGVASRGRNTSHMTLDQVDIGAANPAYA